MTWGGGLSEKFQTRRQNFFTQFRNIHAKKNHLLSHS